MMYNDLVKTYFFKPNHIGVIDLDSPFSGHSRVGEPGQSTFFDLYLQCSKQGGIEKLCFKAVGSPYLIAALESLCHRLQGKSIHETAVAYQDLVQELDIPRSQYPVALQVVQTYEHLAKCMQHQLMRK